MGEPLIHCGLWLISIGTVAFRGISDLRINATLGSLSFSPSRRPRTKNQESGNCHRWWESHLSEVTRCSFYHLFLFLALFALSHSLAQCHSSGPLQLQKLQFHDNYHKLVSSTGWANIFSSSRFVLLRVFRLTIMQQSYTDFLGGLGGGWKDNFRLRHMHCKFILGRQLCHMMSLTVLRFICTVKSGNCTYVLAPSPSPSPSPSSSRPQRMSSYISLHTWDINFCVKSVSGPKFPLQAKFVMCIIYFFHSRLSYLIRDIFLWSQRSIRLHSICITIKLLGFCKNPFGSS